jgi:hypothetical protein
VPVAHACNPKLLRRHQSGGSWFKANPGQIVHQTLFQKNPSQKRAGGVAQGVDPEFILQYCKKKKERKK